ncbi:MAG: NAD(+) synthase [Sphaerochaeta sp.]
MKDGFIKVGTTSPILYPADVIQNTKQIIKAIKKADEEKVRVLVFPELSITAYTAADLFLMNDLQDRVMDSLKEIVEESKKYPSVLSVVGAPLIESNKLYNTAVVLKNGKILGVVPKLNIPNYQEFYEKRWFSTPKDENKKIKILDQEVMFGTRLTFSANQMRDFVLAVEICEDLWVPNAPSQRHCVAGATVIANPSATDDLVGKSDYRRKLVEMQSAKCIAAYLYSGASEGESSTDLVFTAHNLICQNGKTFYDSEEVDDFKVISDRDKINTAIIDVQSLANDRRKMNTFYSDVDGYDNVCFDVEVEETSIENMPISQNPFIPSSKSQMNRNCEKILNLQSQGLLRRLNAAHCKSAVIGLSGGLDSTLALLVAVRAFKKGNLPLEGIHAISMPCFGTTKRTKSNSEKLATALKVTFNEINITKAVRQHFKDIGHDEKEINVVYENSQARERTQILMDIANKVNGLVIGTGDLSELALGWATFNGDHMSMYGVNSSVPKTLVKHLVTYTANNNEDDIKEVLLDIVNTPVSPELKPPTGNGEISQITEDLVGPYILHDFFLYYFVRCSFSFSKISRLAVHAFDGVYDSDFINGWLDTFIWRFFAQQFKRSTLPDGPKVGSVTLSPRGDWRMPSDAPSTDWKRYKKHSK